MVDCLLHKCCSLCTTHLPHTHLSICRLINYGHFWLVPVQQPMSLPCTFQPVMCIVVPPHYVTAGDLQILRCKQRWRVVKDISRHRPICMGIHTLQHIVGCQLLVRAEEELAACCCYWQSTECATNLCRCVWVHHSVICIFLIKRSINIKWL